MKKYLFTLVTMLVMTMTAKAMSYEEASSEALFLTDKMAYELGLSDEQYDAAYEINLDYLMELETSNDLYGTYWSRRNLDMSYVLTATQYNLFLNAAYFYRPVTWLDGFKFSIYERYTDAALLFFSIPKIFSTYFGGHSWLKNGNKSWYKGRTFSVKNILKPAPKKVDIKAASKKIATANKDKIPVNTKNHSSAKPANNNSKPANNNSKPANNNSKPANNNSKPSTSTSKTSSSSTSKP
ncbi:MAG: hypothetical protein LUC91_07515, partial [Prevotella sp.]|nr:hypothetical protein [Prevotella sp.]